MYVCARGVVTRDRRIVSCNLQQQRLRCSRLEHFFNRRKKFRFQNALHRLLVVLYNFFSTGVVTDDRRSYLLYNKSK
jgi:hypothetical protein